jgi:hypothetical protein
MSTFAALALATPIFGFALTPPSGAPLASPAPGGGLIQTPAFAQLGGGGEADPAEAGAADEAPAAERPAEVAEAAEEAEEAEGPSSDGEGSDLAAMLRQRQQLGDVHRAFGIATWGAMLVTAVLGTIQYYNLYGFGAGPDDNPCVTGDAIFGQDQCWGQPWAHRIAAMTTTALYGTTFALSFALPDPLNASEGDGEYAERLRIHKVLRWVHFGGMLAQIFLGFATAQNWFGIDRANDYEAQRALATIHQGIGWATFGVLTAAGAIMVF